MVNINVPATEFGISVRTVVDKPKQEDILEGGEWHNK